MWIDRKIYATLEARAIAAESVRTTLEHTNLQLEAVNDWMRLRLSQVERERAQLLHHYLGIKIEVPEIEKSAPEPGRIAGHPLMQTLSFEDIGNEAASKQGIGWNDDGSLKFDLPSA